MKLDCKKAHGAIALMAAALLGCTSAASAQSSAGGFYREADQPVVMYQYLPNRFCHVQNKAQMEAFGGFPLVNVVRVLNMVGLQTGDCGWPNGYYRRSDGPTVYRLTGSGPVANLGRDICYVVSPKQLQDLGGAGHVMVIPPESDIGRGRGNIAACY